jgi:hypothetical protein
VSAPGSRTLRAYPDPGGRALARPPDGLAAVALLALLAATASHADPLATCRALAEPAARLACYDALPATASQPADATASAPPATVPRPVTATAPTPESLFGLDAATTAATLGAVVAVTPPDSLTTTVTTVERTGDGKLLLTLANGQAWRQVDSRTAAVTAGATVRIRRAAFGSYLLSAGDRSQGVRVRRIR